MKYLPLEKSTQQSINQFSLSETYPFYIFNLQTIFVEIFQRLKICV